LIYKEKQIMELLSFVLGIAFVVVIAIAIVAVYALVKVNKVSKELKQTQLSLSSEVERIYRNQNDENRAIYEHITNRVRDIESQLDSRFDKLIARKQLLKS
jgi:predicted PurR-regulated permease PerM